MAGRQSYQFGEFLLDDGERRVSRPMQLAPKTYEVLVALLRRAGGLVMKQELHAQVWPEARVEEGILAVHVSALRRALDGQDNTPYIETVSRSAYRFTVPVIERNSAELPTAEIAELCKQGHAHLRAASMYEVPKAPAAFRAAIALDPTDAPHMPGWACLLCTGTVSNAAILRRFCRGEGLRAPGFGYRSRLVRKLNAFLPPPLFGIERRLRNAVMRRSSSLSETEECAIGPFHFGYFGASRGNLDAPSVCAGSALMSRR